MMQASSMGQLYLLMVGDRCSHTIQRRRILCSCLMELTRATLNQFQLQRHFADCAGLVKLLDEPFHSCSTGLFQWLAYGCEIQRLGQFSIVKTHHSNIVWDGESEIMCSPQRTCCKDVVAGKNSGWMVLYLQQFFCGGAGGFDSMLGQSHVAFCKVVASFRECCAVASESP